MASFDLSLSREDRALTAGFTRSRLVAWLTPILLYLLACCALLAPVVEHPNQPYNWEPYAAAGALRFWDAPTPAVLRLTGGLMTDSGDTPLVVLPAWLGYRLAGVSLASMREPIALLAALAPVLLWVAGRRLVDARIALMAAALLAVAPAFVFYGRTATNVGISLVPALATIYLLARVVERPQDRRWLIGLQVALVVNSYAYAPIRFLWLIVLGALFVELALRPGELRNILVAFTITLVCLPLFLGLAGREHPPAALARYYDGRGEHVFALSAYPDRFEQYLDLSEEERAGGSFGDQPAEMARRLLADNSEDLANLLLDRQTRPVAMDFWNEHGQLYAWPLVPFFIVGLCVSVARAPSSWRARLMLALFAGFTVPLLLTSQVHVGRLIFALPLLLLLVGVGVQAAAQATQRVWHRLRPMTSDESVSPLRSNMVFAALAIPLFTAALVVGLRGYQGAVPDTGQSAMAGMLRDDLPVLASRRHGALLLARPEKLEHIDIAELRLALEDVYQFVDVGAEPPAPTNERPIIYYGGLFTRLQAGEPPPDHCNAVVYVSRELVDQFLALADAAWRACDGPLRFLTLPD